MKIMMIVAMDEDEIIGNDQNLPWRLSADLKRFKKLTIADGFNAVIMGRKTWESLPNKFKPLPERLNIVMSRDTKWTDEGAEVALYPGRAIEIAYANGCDECWISVVHKFMNYFYKVLMKYMLLGFIPIEVEILNSQILTGRYGMKKS